MTIRQKLNISFLLIVSIIISIISISFYTIYKLNTIHLSQNHRYDQLRRVEKLQTYKNSFSWIVLDIITDYEKRNIVEDRLEKFDQLYVSLLEQKQEIMNHFETSEEKENLESIFFSFETLEKYIRDELTVLVSSSQSVKKFDDFSKNFDKASEKTKGLLSQEIEYLQKKLDQTDTSREQFIDTMKLELVLLLFVAFMLSIIISSKITNEIKDMLKKLNIGVLQLFNEDKTTIKVDIGEENELTEITKNLNEYLEQQSSIIHSREELLRNISHELKTPITKGMFLVEKLKNSVHSNEMKSIHNVFIDIQELTSKLLEREKLNFAVLHLAKFRASSLILDALSKLSIDDESKIILKIEDDFDIKADKYYMTLVMKNLIDNAIKYADTYPVEIEAGHKKLLVKNVAKRLQNDLFYYTQPFTREPNQQRGHGLGLNIVQKVLKMHNFTLEYTYETPHNIFSVNFA